MEFLADLESAPFTLARGKDLVHEGELRQAAYFIQAGWGCSFKLLPDGGRQIMIDAVRTARQRCWRYDWVLDLDIKAFFDNVRHDRLLAKVGQRVDDADVMHLLKVMLKASGKQGVPQAG